MVTEIPLFESPDLTPLDFCLWGSMKGEVYKREVDTADELVDVAGCAKRGGDRLRRTTRHLDTRDAKCVVGDGGILERLLWTVTVLSFLCSQLAI